jgi:hypothetical protein
VDTQQFIEPVRKGAALLDEQEPGWADRIELGDLEMHNPCFCVLGQLHNSYGQGLAAVGLVMGTVEDPFPDYVRAPKYGFAIGDTDLPYGPAWAALEAAWVVEILKRRSEDDLTPEQWAGLMLEGDVHAFDQ